tara:strand:- start:435 stop:836 length:402 start_codon:yes stop_codon:yes gene_type:complete
LEDHEHSAFIYIIQSESCPDWVKIGFSKDVKRRIQTFNTAVPLPYRALAAWSVDKHRLAENLIHECLREFRSPTGNEHFQLRTDLEHERYLDDDGFYYEGTISHRHELIDYIEQKMFQHGIAHTFAVGYLDYL